MSQPSLPLLCRSVLLTGESLSSLLARLTTLNHYGTTGILARLCLNGTHDDLYRPSEAATFERLATLTKLPCSALYAATAHRFAETLTPPGVQTIQLEFSSGERVPLLTSGIAYDQLRPATTSQFCPMCLAISAHHRVAWFPIAVAACLEHQCLLLDRCPDCLTFVAIQDIVDAQCCRCGYDLTQSSAASISTDVWGEFSQRVIQTWLGLLPLTEQSPRDLFPDQPPAVLYRVLDGLRASLMGVRADWEYLHRLPRGTLAVRPFDPNARIPDEDVDGLSLSFERTMPPQESYRLYATALNALVGWPKGFYEFLRAYGLREVTDLHRRLEADLGIVSSLWIEKHWQRLAFVQEAFDQYLTDTYALSPSVTHGSWGESALTTTEFTYTTIPQAARFLGVSPKAIARLVEAGLLFRYEFPGRREEKYGNLMRRAEVMELGNRWANGIPLKDATLYLGLSESTTLELVRIGLLFAESGPDVDGSPDWRFSQQAVTECYQEVTKGLVYHIPTRTTIGLVQAAQMLMAVGLNEADILACVANSELHGQLSERFSGLGDVLFNEANLRVFLDKFKAERGWVEPKEIARRMRVREATIVFWVEAGLIAPVIVCGTTHYFEPSSVEIFIAEHVFDEEAAAIMGVGVDVIRQWARTGALQPVSGPGVDLYRRPLYRRQDVERLRQTTP